MTPVCLSQAVPCRPAFCKIGIDVCMEEFGGSTAGFQGLYESSGHKNIAASLVMHNPVYMLYGFKEKKSRI